MARILVINGPNLNLLGIREPSVYGRDTLENLESKCITWGEEFKCQVSCVQSNHEGEIVDAIQQAYKKFEAIIINAGAYTHTSIAIRDAISAINIPVFEVHISNIHSREEFRHKSYLSDIAVGVVCGFGILGYKVAIEMASMQKQ